MNKIMGEFVVSRSTTMAPPFRLRHLATVQMVVTFFILYFMFFLEPLSSVYRLNDSVLLFWAFSYGGWSPPSTITRCLIE
ncbi:Uncharacterized protein TCM_009682 [Theobroma cacao]|uniref:Uncharacterized protein n=1 Tax=Theobroma cacao TaxID=3641 RepID=A0A061ECY7_THECC|nr:Uncharacterized protein TCM_009682 [Theobroma cacao]